jgi:hypothetical protein
MDLQIRLLSAIKREIPKIIGKAETEKDKLMLIEFAERTLQDIKDDLCPKSIGSEKDPG